MLDVAYYNPADGQDLTITCDGEVIEQLTRQPAGLITRKYALTLVPGANEVTFDFARYNHHGLELSSTDGRPMAGTFQALDLTLD